MSYLTTSNSIPLKLILYGISRRRFRLSFGKAAPVYIRCPLSPSIHINMEIPYASAQSVFVGSISTPQLRIFFALQIFSSVIRIAGPPLTPGYSTISGPVGSLVVSNMVICVIFGSFPRAGSPVTVLYVCCKCRFTA